MATKTPKAPSYLDEIAREQWKLKIKVLAERGDITSEDYTNLELYCVNYSLYRKAVQDIAERGFSITNSQGTEARNPALTAKSEAEKIIIKMSSLLGFDPVSRRKNPIDTEETDEINEILTM
ncbi:phage terminase small subunit P27 family [Glaesserella parasuis]|uniref:phage terminase small subunit P27 family n=1 Tax=Glaesserella parasuis TaxID=738 RepID=UPI0003ABDC03|nr:phage terminase small subunit P27 family [Glaesserella parasuis]ATW46091.1 terminase [Glaesserella parasuis str. Nagasaki]EQA01408.1 phage terminase, small subunit, P27 family [Glaesserella parasuis str. Nagasaki]EYE72136.1 bacteriophage protein [Glaesserella parasuis str. Nagasaki]MDE3974397.1 phage terminase small subunit P27 family [Glaesserella parasuis]MDG6823893.1 phage terminase small subunit P27 family [Glaesserella parasuis]